MTENSDFSIPEKITSDKQNDQCLEILSKLMRRKEEDLSPDEQEYIGLLATKIEAYEDVRYPIPEVSPEEQLVIDAAQKFREDYTKKSFSGRHPELGKMVNCKVCSRRHRSSQVCEQKIITPAAQTRKGINGAGMFAKKRIRPHYSHARLELVQMTQDLFPKYFPRIEDAKKAMQAARGEAQAVLSRKSRLRRHKLVLQQHRSRQINAGLFSGGIR